MILHCIPRYTEAEKWARISEKYNLNFEYNEFFNPEILDNEALISEIMHIYLGLGRDLSADTLHGAFLDICINSHDSKIRTASIYRIEQSIDIASKLGVKGVVFHTNYISGFSSKAYRNSWVSANVDFWGNICRKYNNINIYLENMFDESPQLLYEVASQLKGQQNFGVCLDIAHAKLSETGADSFINMLSPFTRHIHINDNDGIEDLHLAVGDGVIDWSVLKDKKLFYNNPSVLIEVSTMERLDKSLNYLIRNGAIDENHSEVKQNS